LVGRGSASTLLLLCPDALPNVLKVTESESSDVTILSVPACTATDLLDRVFVQLRFFPPAHGFLDGGKDHSLDGEVKAHANGICGYQEFDIAQSVVKHVCLRLLCVWWQGPVNDCTVICFLPRILLLVETLVNSVLNLEHGLSTKGDDTVSWQEVRELFDSFMFNV
jgi:hypothetical protein